LRKSLVAAVSALCLIAFSAVAYAQYAAPSHTQTGSVSPNSAKKSARLTTELTTGATDEGTVSNFTFLFPKELKIATKGFKFCTVSVIVKAGTDSACPSGSKIGNGSAAAFVGSRKGANIGFNVTLYAGSKTSLTVYIVGKGSFSTIKRAIPATLKSASGDFKQALSTNIPKDIQFVGGATPVVLASVKISIKGTKGKNKIVTTGKCPSSKQWLLGTKLTYSRPAGAVSNAKATVKCK
jgi:hypothetical protein